MSKGPIEFLNPEHLSKESCLIVPGRLNPDALYGLKDVLGKRSVLWLVEETDHIVQEVQEMVEKSGAAGMAFVSTDPQPEKIGEEIRSQIEKDTLVVFLPGKMLHRPGTAVTIPGRTLNFLGQLGLPVQPLASHCPSQSRLSVTPTAGQRLEILRLGDVIPAAKVSGAAIRQGILESAQVAFSTRNFLDGSLPMALLEGLKKHGSSHALFDGTDDSKTGYDKLLGAAIVLAQEIKKETKQDRVGIILPPGKGGMVANLAVLFANKVPVNINFTGSHEAINSAIKQSGVDRFITADPFVRKFPGFPWPPNRQLIFIERRLPVLKKKIIRWVILSKLLPVKLLAKFMGLNPTAGDSEAVLLFTSGSSGEPKGVSLSHRNILANVCQFGTPLALEDGASLLGSLPLFHSFGSTVTLWYPIIEGVNLVTYPSPLEAKRLAELVQKHEVTLMITTPTFLRGFMRRVDSDQLSSLKLLATGAEKLPESLAYAFEKKFGILPLEGYGLTETSPATNLNLPEPSSSGDLPVLPSKRFGSVGSLLPGVAIQIKDAVSEKEQPLTESGIIYLKGPNIFAGYLNRDDLSEKVLKDGWFCTGDVGRVDDDGFLYIEGRISRFSKIAGEMVPHETVEAAVTKALGLDGEEERKVAIVGMPDEKKGEALVLLSTTAGPHLEQECIDLRYKLLDVKIPSLWCPREIVPVDEIPVLASGKLDIRGCAELALEIQQSRS